jgi:hypothetical protein
MYELSPQNRTKMFHESPAADVGGHLFPDKF